MTEKFLREDKRTDYCGVFTKKDIGRKVTVNGWCQKSRNLGSLLFIDLRDRTGIVQLAFDENTGKDLFEIAHTVRSEYVLSASGTVRPRAEGATNASMPTGEVEIEVDRIKILSEAQTPPFAISDENDVNQELRLQYRFLDLRRPAMQERIKARSEMVRLAREYFVNNNGFLDIETPNLIKPTPEGARDYLVPSRVHQGCFYALPQSPQLYKQMLMYSGFDRYFQIARCYRDEDLRADRQPEFTQIDEEMSFVDENDIMSMNEGFIKYLFDNYLHMPLEIPFRRMTYKEAMDRFGSDKPDTRFQMELQDISDIVKNSGFGVFSGAVQNGGSVRAIKCTGGASMTRKEIDKLGEFVKSYGSKGLAWYKVSQDGTVSSSFAKFLSEKETSDIVSKLDIKNGDIAFFSAGRNKIVFASLGALRCKIAKQMDLIDKSKFNFLWVTEFPLFEYSDEEDRWQAMHHPFTMPMTEDIEYIESDPERCRARAYDIVLNGTELGGGSIRINQTDLQQKMFKVLGISEQSADEKFGFLLEAFKYGVPPHGGLAFGLDRLVCLLLRLDDIREVIAFPKAKDASELMSHAPAPGDPKSLKELGIKVL